MIIPSRQLILPRKEIARPSRQRGFMLSPYRFGGGGGGSDPDFSAVKILMHFDGSDGSPSFVDVKGHTFTPYNGAVLSSAQAKFGPTSARLDGTRYVASTATADQALNGQWCVEQWVHLSSITGFRHLWSTYENGFTLRTYVYINGSAVLSSIPGLNSGSGALVANVWQHIAITRDAINTVRLFVDGLVKSTVLNYTTNHSADIAWLLGHAAQATGNSLWGYMDDFRVSVGAARYTAPFVPPPAPFPNG